MRSYIVASALCGLAAAAPAPAPQKINIGAIADLSTPTALGPEPVATTTPAVTYVPEVAASSAAAAISTDPPTVDKREVIAKRAASTRTVNAVPTCDAYPIGAGPVPGDGSVNAYLASDNELVRAALAAGTPPNYEKSFTNLQGSTQQIGYLTYKTIDSGDYDVNGCAEFCNSEKFCLGFNIFYERDPTLDANANCPNPPPTTNVKCSLYGYPVAAGSATNTGQWRGPEDSNGEAFHVVIAGSNGYSKTKTPSNIDDFSGPTSLPAAINAPLDNGYDTYNGMKLYNEGPFDPSVCAAACEAQTAFDKEHLVQADGTYKPCNFFTAYILTKNDVPQGTYCSFYTREWDSTYAVNTGYFWEQDVYKVKSTVAYTLTDLDSGRVASAPAPQQS